MNFRSRVVTIPLALDLRMYADSDNTYKTLDLDVPELEGLLPHADSLLVEWLLDQVADNEIEWNIDAYAGWDRNHERAAVAFFASDQALAGSQSGTPSGFASSSWGRHVRLQLKWRLVAATAAKEGVFSAVLYVTTKGV